MELLGEKSHLADRDVPDKTVADIEENGQDNADDRGIERGTDTLQQVLDTFHRRFGGMELDRTDTHDQSEEGT